MASQNFLNYIGGALVSADSGQWVPKLSPFDNSLLGQICASDAMDVIKALVPAKKAQSAYEKTSLSERVLFLNRIADALSEKSESYAFQEALHQGLSKNFVHEKSILAAIHFFRKAAQECQDFDEQSSLATPVGVVSIISSWCLSLRLICERLAPALAAGNAVLIKVSELSPVTGMILAEILEQALCPPGLVQIFQGSGLQVGSLLAAHPSVRAVSFVGKSSHAENVVKAATHQFKKIQVSTGTKNSVLVLSEVNFETLMPQILESFLMGQGQLCWNSHRLFVLESISKNFFICLQSYLSSLKPAAGPQDSSAWMPLINTAAVEQAQRKSSDAQIEHAKIISGEKLLMQSGNFVNPAFTLNLTNCSVLQQDELNTNLFIATEVKYSHEMVKWSNTGYYGHSAVIWGPSEKAYKLALPMQCSKVWINSWMDDEDFIVGQKQSCFGNMDIRAFGDFYSDVKKVTAPR